jgi:hypothetical protein
LIAYGWGVEDGYKIRPQRWFDRKNLILRTTFAIMLGSRQLFPAAVLAFHAAALPVTESHDDAWSSCSSSFSAYSSSSSEYEIPYTTSTIYTKVYDSRAYSFEQPMTTLCDGRARGNGPYTTYSVETTETLDPPRTTTLFDWYHGERPSCTEWTIPDYTPEATVTEATATEAAVQTSSPDSVLFPRADYAACPGSGVCSIAARANP